MNESEEQQALFLWAAYQSGKYPELKLIYHIPNEGKRSISAGSRLKSEGLKKGVPDICLPISNGKYSALYIEMKSEKGKPSKEQLEWIECLNKAGNHAVIAYGWENAAKEIIKYLEE